MYSVVYVSYNTNKGYCLNHYDIDTQAIKTLSNVAYTYHGNDYYYQPSISSSPSNQANYITLVGKGNMGWLEFLTLDFEKGSYNETRANVEQNYINTFYSSGFDYYSNSLYLSYISSSLCVRYDVLDVKTSEWVNITSKYCDSSVLSNNDKAFPIMYNSIKYLITSSSSTNQTVMKRIDIVNGIPTGTDLFSFINVGTPGSKTPIFFAYLQNGYITIATYTNFGKIQVNTICLTDFSTSSFLVPATSRVYSILTIT
ncbi:hypothetical protein DICPUDRAFT_81988 [Dictyostelium purpureum]|uniref:Uncharacterized protein n=1 Tax=Dictyostelium purpureum TaxID=5786 RepID=F0ZV67_DICPU|nr:uncharacterized protein DICPUDRAFT_81988 [Dictyostelium purpureum]EGC32174.1 hypothetical protein DICPUDRAFT_81988 [Dictyostelium purpureum]|eukprot:XP_003291312.1 hypothetical protein DICPUDRAFT_81988 [Dictyostelium purpureum]